MTHYRNVTQSNTRHAEAYGFLSNESTAIIFYFAHDKTAVADCENGVHLFIGAEIILVAVANSKPTNKRIYSQEHAVTYIKLNPAGNDVLVVNN